MILDREKESMAEAESKRKLDETAAKYEIYFCPKTSLGERKNIPQLREKSTSLNNRQSEWKYSKITERRNGGCKNVLQNFCLINITNCTI